MMSIIVISRMSPALICKGHFQNFAAYNWQYFLLFCPFLLVVGHCLPEFSSNPNYTNLIQLIKILGLLESSRQVCWVKLELNSAGHRPSKTEFGHPCLSRM